MVKALKSTTWPGGLACELVKRSKKKYGSDDTLAIAETTTKLSKLKLKKEDDPEDLEDNIAVIEAQLGCTLNEQQTITTIVRAAGKHYTGVIYQVTERKEAAGEKVTPDDLFDMMGKAWKIGGGGNSDDSDDSVNETALTLIIISSAKTMDSWVTEQTNVPSERQVGRGSSWATVTCAEGKVTRGHINGNLKRTQASVQAVGCPV